MRCTITCAMIALSFASAAPCQAPQVEPVKLEVRRAPTLEGIDSFGDPGVSLEVAVRAPGKPLLAVDEEKSKLVRFVDDAGTDLAKTASKGFFFWVSKRSDFGDGPKDACILEIRTKGLPAKKAGRIELEAEVAMRSASGSERKEQTVKLKKGAKITCGPVPMFFSSVDESDFGDSAVTVQVSANEPMDAVKEIEFLDAAGAPMKTESMGSSSFGFGGKKTYSRAFGLPQKPAKVTVRLTYFAKVETVTVPIKLSLGMGLQ
ncbi:MAG: hypothetical protein ACON4Z_01880 [Planctomycetota bacterium]